MHLLKLSYFQSCFLSEYGSIIHALKISTIGIKRIAELEKHFQPFLAQVHDVIEIFYETLYMKF